jgi:hypothetical protein
MRILVLNTDYYGFQKSLYAADPGLAQAPYLQQQQARNDTLFGMADFYPRNFAALGHLAQGIVANNIWMQTAWAHVHSMNVPPPPDPSGMQGETGIHARLKHVLAPLKPILHPIAHRLGLTDRLNRTLAEILLAQVEDFQPDVILNQNIIAIDPGIVGKMRRPGRTIIAQCGIAPPAGLDLRVYDFGISLIPWVVRHFRANGLAAVHRHLGFDESILSRLGPPPPKDIEVSFVGSLNAMHGKRIAYLEAVAQRFALALYIPSMAAIPAASPLQRCHRGSAWGREMYDVIRRSKITLNFHADFARGTAGNMRLYEATGVGTCLMTDNLSDLSSLFVPNKELLTYDDIDACVLAVERALIDDARREEIAQAGQKRTLADHTYRHRTAEIIDLVANPPRLD